MTTASNKGFPPVSESLGDNLKEAIRQIARALNRVLQGKFNATIDVTLTANATTTTLTDPRIFATSFIGFMPQTANAKTAMVAGIYVTARIKGSCTLNHANAAATDQTFTALIIG